MIKKNLLISEKFKNLLDLELSESIEYIENLDVNDINRENYILGQGINKFFKKLTKIFSIDKNYTLEKKEYVHKRFSKNVILTKPHKININTFESHVLINPKSAEIEDHLTGYHIPAMVIVEAARQMMLSVIERHYNEFQTVGDCYIVINAIDSTFNKFIFPWDIDQTFIINSISKSKSSIKYESSSIFRQNNEICARVHIKFSVFNKYRLLEIEKAHAQLSFNKYISSMHNNQKYE